MKLVIVSLFLIVSTAKAANTVDQIIADEGWFVYADGSSFFAFQKGGLFQSGPMGMSGRTIEGTWTKDQDGGYVVKGRWGWANGGSVTNDFRTMSILLSNPHEPFTDLCLSSTMFGPTITNRPKKVYKAYALIDDLAKGKDTKPQQSAAPLPPTPQTGPSQGAR